MDAQTLKEFMQLQRELMTQQQNAFNEVITKLGQKEETKDNTAVVNSLNARITPFAYNADEGETFDRWYSRYEDIIKNDGASLKGGEMARFIVSKLERKESEQFRNHLLPKIPSEVELEDTIKAIKKLFNESKSITRMRYELLTVKFDGADRKEYTGNIKRLFNVAQWKQMSEDQAQCLLWTIGLQSSQHTESRLRALREMEANPKITLTELADRLDHVIAMKADADFIGGTKSSVNFIKNKKPHVQQPFKPKPSNQNPPKSDDKKKPPPTPCCYCGDMHWNRDCKQRKSLVCQKCHRTGHIAKMCRQKNSQSNNAVFIAESSAGAKNRIYTDVIINGTPIRMVLDTGAEVTLLNKTDWVKMNKPPLSPPTLNLRTATNKPIDVKGQFQCQFVLNGQNGSGSCHVTDTASLLGMDWISQDKSLFEHLIRGSINAVKSSEAPEVMAKHRIQLQKRLETEFPEVFKAGLGRCTKTKAQLHLKPDAKPTFRKARPVPYAVLPKVSQEINRLVKEGVITPTNYSDFAAPIVVVQKKDGSIRMSTGLNDSLQMHQHPLPTAEDVFSKLNGGNYFTQVDLAEAYLQIEMDDDSKTMLTINTHLGMFHYNRMPFGVKTTPAMFQQVIDTMITGLEGVSAYMDDIIITGATIAEHNDRLQQLFRRIEDYGFRVRSAKCSFLQSQIRFLGFIVDRFGRRPDPAKIEAICQMPAPTDVSKLRSLLGMVQFYGSFVKDLHNYRAALDELTKKDAEFEWTTACQASFDKIRDILKSDLLLTHYDPKLPIVVAADASNYGIGAVITHRFPDGSEKAIFHASRTLTSAQRGYAQIEKEALGLIFAVEKFHRYIHGRKFTLLTDHKPLLAIFGSKKGIPVYSSSRLQRWATILLNYDFNIEYRNTSSFGQADALSRLIDVNKKNLEDEDCVIAAVEAEVDAEHHGITRHLPITATTIQKATHSDPITAAVIQYVQQGNWPKFDKSSPIFPFYSRRESLSIANGTLMFGHRIVIPAQLRQRVRTTLHKAHPGQERMKQLARSYVYWPQIDLEIESLVRNCQDCQAAAKNPVKTTLQPWPTASIPLERIHIDYAGSIDGIYYLVFVDAFSKWPEILPTRTITASRTIELLTPIFARYGNPQTLVSDNGTQFVSSTFQQFCSSRGIKHLRSPPFHPQSNGQAERFVDTFKRALVKLKREETTQEALQTFLMAYRSTPCTSSPGQLSPAENFLKRKMRTIMDLMLPTHLPIETSSSDKMKQQFDHHHGAKWRCYSVGDAVFVKDFRSPNTWLPGTVIARFGSVKYTVRCEGFEWIRHANQLRRRDHLPSSSHLLDFFDLPTTPPPSSDVFTLPTSPSFDCFPPSPCQDVPSTTTLVPRTTTSVPSTTTLAPRTTTSLPSTTTMPPSTTTTPTPPSTTTNTSPPSTTTLPPSTATAAGPSSSLMPAPQVAAPTLRRSTRTVRAPAQLDMDPSRSTYR
ncbi:hypothetical protein B9Z55_012795 [Caenorhabditis nigoni]|uniref:RNA-directed DNA polymerase n=1 Tax=Caenorhabditis nigoni TaxID=1611254 RepID=A0A2G5TYT6_9PELO|nr:hypothetical protein B9Z55_012795 [Caenorhabditis nigoni]